MGFFDVPAPLFNGLDRAMVMLLSPGWRLVCWAAIAGLVTLGLYRLLSPQSRIGRAKRDARQARQRLNAFDGEFSDAGPLIRDQFVTAFRHLGLVLPGTLLSVLPLIALLVWLEGHYAYSYPVASEPPVVSTLPGNLETRWHGRGNQARVSVHKGRTLLADVTISAPIPVIEQHHWWNWLFANPLGYLPAGGVLQRIEIALPARRYLTFGPVWAQGWMAIFLPMMFGVSLVVFRCANIQ